MFFKIGGTKLNKIINIGNRRELFVDDFLVDTAKTTSKKILHKPIRRELIMTNDAPWEANGWVYYTVLQDGNIFRMYYICFPMYNKEKTAHMPPADSISALSEFAAPSLLL